jgi:hypothetical protein
MWHLLTGERLGLGELSQLDEEFVRTLEYIQGASAEDLGEASIETLVTSIGGDGRQVLREVFVTGDNKGDFARMALEYRLGEFEDVVSCVREGLSAVVPLSVLSLFSGEQLEALVCGDQTIDTKLLREMTEYNGVDEAHRVVGWFWEVLDEFSGRERTQFLRFVWGKSRLPRSKAAFERKFVLSVPTHKYKEGARETDQALPSAMTCFFMLKLPPYSTKATLREKLTYAILFCRSIDMDTYARIELNILNEGEGGGAV